MNEVTLGDASQSNGNVELSAATSGIVTEDHDEYDDKDWVSLNELGENLGLPHEGKPPQTISEQIAQVSAEPNPSHLSLTTVEIRCAIPPQNDDGDPAIYGQQASCCNTAVIPGPGAWIPVLYR